MGEQDPTTCGKPPGGRVICRMCNQAEATTRVSVPLPGVRPVEAPCCKPCSAHLLGHAQPPPYRPTLFPRPRFTIRHLMILAGVSGFVHIAIILLVRICVGPGNPAGIRAWTLRMALFTDVFGPVLAAEFLAFWWFERLRWYRITGRWVPLKRLAAEQALLAPALGREWRWASWNVYALRFFSLLLLVQSVYWLLSQKDRPWFPGYEFESLLSVMVVMYTGLALLALGFAASTPCRAVGGPSDPEPEDRPDPDADDPCSADS
jgi:hypothetical protein